MMPIRSWNAAVFAFALIPSALAFMTSEVNAAEFSIASYLE